tara:strand:+ start:729 stop:1016 length:288 start_codon:yes stop_codon:yes gene_type:complete
LDPKKFLEFVKRIDEEEKEREGKEKDAYKETFKEDSNILDFLRIAEEEAIAKDERTGVINYLEMYNQFEERQLKVAREDRLKGNKKKKPKKSPFS